MFHPDTPPKNPRTRFKWVALRFSRSHLCPFFFPFSSLPFPQFPLLSHVPQVILFNFFPDSLFRFSFSFFFSLLRTLEKNKGFVAWRFGELTFATNLYLFQRHLLGCLFSFLVLLIGSICLVFNINILSSKFLFFIIWYANGSL